MLKALFASAALRQLRRDELSTQKLSALRCSELRLVSVRLRPSTRALRRSLRASANWLILDGLCLHALSSFQRTDAVPLAKPVREGNLLTLLPATLPVNPRHETRKKIAPEVLEPRSAAPRRVSPGRIYDCSRPASPCQPQIDPERFGARSWPFFAAFRRSRPNPISYRPPDSSSLPQLDGSAAGHYLAGGGLRPAGPPCTLTRGGP